MMIKKAAIASLLFLLGVAGVALGVLPQPLAPLIDGATFAATGVAEAGKLVLWPGFVEADHLRYAAKGIR